MKTNEKKNTSAKKKLIPAVAMLTTSAVMLSTATYAWFTMSREVEVTGIKLTATTPQTIEISLGQAPDGEVNITTKTEAKEPGIDETLWSHTVATGSVYNEFGKLIPASTINGYNMFYTEKAIKNGRAVSDNGGEPFKSVGENGSAGWTFKNGGKSAETGNAVTAANKDGSGYYIDIPVWFRTTSAEDVTLGLDVSVKNPNEDSGLLYKAARVAILPSNKAASKVFLGDDDNTADSYYTSGKGVSSAGTTVADSHGNVDIAKEVTIGDNSKVTNSTDATKVATVPATTRTGYGDAVKYYVRVWLEGEDKNCWNANAGQSFNIDLKFYDLSNT